VFEKSGVVAGKVIFFLLRRIFFLLRPIFFLLRPASLLLRRILILLPRRLPAGRGILDAACGPAIKRERRDQAA
jgi:hypothetical protein